jgi:DNA-binding response OmpR family regulator
MRILLVDDDEPTARSIRRYLDAHGHEVRCAFTIVEAIVACESEGFDLLICDLILPDGTGWKLMERQRERCALRAIMLCGFERPEDVRMSREAGFLAHLVKPHHIPLLPTIVRDVTRANVKDRTFFVMPPTSLPDGPSAW